MLKIDISVDAVNRLGHFGHFHEERSVNRFHDRGPSLDLTRSTKVPEPMEAAKTIREQPGSEDENLGAFLRIKY